MPPAGTTWEKCSDAWPKYTMRPLPSSNGRELTPGVSSRKSDQFFRA